MAQTTGAVDVRIGEGIAWLVMTGEADNRLTPAMRSGLLAALTRVEADPEIACIILTGGKAGFSGGDDPAELDAAHGDPGPAELCRRIELCRKPVIAALHGRALGIGAELALAAHYRLAARGTLFGLPNVALGLPPAAGATQRLPRLLGAGPALEMMLSGEAIRLDETAPAGLLDRLAEGPLDEEARAFCAELRAEGLGPRPAAQRREGFADPIGYQQAVAGHRAEVTASANPARREIVAAVEAAQLLPFAGGLDFEADAYESCRESEAGTALRAMAAAERIAAAEMTPAGAAPRRICVLGDGPLAVPMLLALLPIAAEVDWGCGAPEALHAGVISLRDRLDESRRVGVLSAEEAEERLSRLRVGPAAEMARAAELILVAGPGQSEVAAPPGVSRLPVYPGRVAEVGLRFAPSPVTARLVEVVVGPRARDGQLADAEALAAQMGCLALRVRSGGESLGGRIFDACCRAADALVDMGQSPFDIDAACRDWGWRRGPFLRRDQMGLARLGAQARAEGAANWATELVRAGRSGREAGRGFYDWPDSGLPVASSEVEALLAARRPAAPALPAAELRGLLVGAMANEGARMLGTGMLRRASDLDLVALQVLELPRWRGGPMHAALRMGARGLREALARVTHPDRAFWQPHPLWDDLVTTRAASWPGGA
ncbi:enoyl-CoA hydratase/isomerase family protein [Alloyangia pacifica]|uniref:3-hydroxyacyl-CoA dehydrogenase n=1 Tax=Alloyangia pacifica TaxID=311180 RepID=A0A1I6W985_9RHOB|nr:enoyl-CoA hydratase/isomerase family protein [Alloyangia pacifica]SDI46278.1 3-hydroxyacyl-CoA dehydrogenase [Alloyangia pacifica]SFT22549.1 3-hydroxyacyl-CoA dehydrogenase [Alloyangia pacifica]